MDRKGRDLAMSSRAWSLFADPKEIKDRRHAARQLHRILGDSYSSIYSKIKDSKKRFVWIERMLDQASMQRISDLKIHGLDFVEEYRRMYPNENLAAQILGLVGREGNGLEGLELTYNEQLEGDKKKVSVRRDARGRPLTVDGMLFTENPDGREIKLTLDGELQHILESELSQALVEFEAERAYGVILNAHDSGVLAMATAENTGDRKRNRVIADCFEPGSTIKTFVVAAGLREKILQANSRYDTENGVMKIGGRTIREAESKHVWPSLTVSEILAYSSNIGTTKIAFDVGPELIRKTFLDFGFSEKSGIDLPGEARGVVHALPWPAHLFSNISFGHGMTASPLQMANAYAAIANGGVLRKPYLVKSVTDPETGRTTEFNGDEIRRVLTPADAAALRLMLAGVTAPGGTGVNAKVDGFPVAGKTGTAQKVNPNGRGYLPGGYISSFAGFLPANDPEFVIYVAIDQPKKKNTYYATTVAAPIFSRIASYAARKNNLAPVLLSEKNLANGNSGKTLAKSSVGIVESTPSIVNPVIPDLANLTTREVLKRLSADNVHVEFRGSGIVAETYPQAGFEWPESRNLMVYLRE